METLLHWAVEDISRNTNGLCSSSLLPIIPKQRVGGAGPRAIFLSFSFFGRPTFISFIERRGSEIKKREASTNHLRRNVCQKEKEVVRKYFARTRGNNNSGKHLLSQTWPSNFGSSLMCKKIDVHVYVCTCTDKKWH